MSFLLVFPFLFNVLMAQASPLYEPSFTLIDGDKKTATLAEYKGKPLLIVNIATRCGYTKQLDGLEKLYGSYKDKGLVVLGIPSNDFMGQTPEEDVDVKKFCKLRYGVTFPLTSKMTVKGKDKHPLIDQLIAGDKREIAWNFEKFVVDKKGTVVGRYKSSVKPDDKDLIKTIEKTL